MDENISVEIIASRTPELAAALSILVGQLSESNAPPSAAQLNEIISSRATKLLVARVNGEIAGMLTLASYRIPTGIRAIIEDVVVDTKYRGRGLGETLTRAVLDCARSLGAKSVDLTSRPSREAANRLYQRLGFERREDTTVSVVS